MSPTTMEANIRRLLEHTAPEVHGELERRLMRARYDAGRLHLTSLAEVPAEEAARLFPA